MTRAMTLPTNPVRQFGMFLTVALCASVIGIAFLTDSANAFDNHQQNPVAGDPQCSDLFPGTTPVRNDPPQSAYQPPVTFVYSDSGHHVTVTIDPGYELVGVIVHGGASGSNVYDSNTGMGGRLIATRNPGGGLDQIHYTIACYTEIPPPTTTAAPPTTTAAPTTTVASETDVSPATTTAPPFDVVPTTTVAAAPPTTIPDVVVEQLDPTPAPEPVVARPTFTG